MVPMSAMASTYGTMAVISSGVYANKALRFAEGKPVKLIDGAQPARPGNRDSGASPMPALPQRHAAPLGAVAAPAKWSSQESLARDLDFGFPALNER